MIMDIAWKDLLGWDQEQIDDLRFVGYSYVKQGKYEIALRFFEALITINPLSTYDLQTLGGIHLELGNSLAALDTIEKALKLDASHGSTLLNRIKALFGLGHKREALAEAQKLLAFSDQKIVQEAEALLLAYS